MKLEYYTGLAAKCILMARRSLRYRFKFNRNLISGTFPG